MVVNHQHFNCLNYPFLFKAKPIIIQNYPISNLIYVNFFILFPKKTTSRQLASLFVKKLEPI